MSPALAPLVLLSVLAADNLLKNADFRSFDGSPAGWTVEIGARNGEGASSEISPLEGGGVSFEGSARTEVWRMLSQEFPFDATRHVRLDFEARVVDPKVEGNQFDNCFVGLGFYDSKGQRLGMPSCTIATDDWAEQSLTQPIPRGTVAARVLIFLSHSGQLEVRRLRLEQFEVRPEDSFDQLVEELGLRYSYLSHRKVAWPDLARRYREQALAAGDTGEFVEVIERMLAEFKDLHIWIDPPGGRRIQPYVDRPEQNVDFRRLAAELTGVRQIGKLGFVGRTKEGFGYLALGSLEGTPDQFAPMLEAFDSLLDAPALILDMRANGGGAEQNGTTLAGTFASEPVVYARRSIRSGPKPTDLSTPRDSVLSPRKGVHYDGPVVVLTGPVCMSSGEGMVLALAACPRVTLIGQPTRGASANPQPFDLPNGVRVWIPSWVAMDAGGTVIEGVGVQPDVKVEYGGKGDPIMAKAIEVLGKQIAGDQ
ncbi:MAG: S41 family peptidase [Planctomycetota bacterium]